MYKRQAGARVFSAGLRTVCDAQLGLRRDGQPRGGPERGHDADRAHHRHFLLRGVHGDVPAERRAQTDCDLYRCV